jgi:hypothetical protein
VGTPNVLARGVSSTHSRDELDALADDLAFRGS